MRIRSCFFLLPLAEAYAGSLITKVKAIAWGEDQPFRWKPANIGISFYCESSLCWYFQENFGLSWADRFRLNNQFPNSLPPSLPYLHSTKKSPFLDDSKFPVLPIWFFRPGVAYLLPWWITTKSTDFFKAYLATLINWHIFEAQMNKFYLGTPLTAHSTHRWSKFNMLVSGIYRPSGAMQARTNKHAPVSSNWQLTLRIKGDSHVRPCENFMVWRKRISAQAKNICQELFSWWIVNEIDL